jgi:hypothetical protein
MQEGTDPHHDKQQQQKDNNAEDNSDKNKEEMSTSLAPPSHIAPDGTFVRLPPPGPRDRRRFFERSVARHGLLLEDLEGGKMGSSIGSGSGSGSSKKRRSGVGKGGVADAAASVQPLDDDGEESESEPASSSHQKQQQPQQSGKKTALSTAMKIHPLAVASARLQSGGLSELNRAINLSGLVSSGEYFGMSNVVDPSLLVATTATAAITSAAGVADGSAAGDGKTKAVEAPSSSATASATSQLAKSAADDDDDNRDEHRVKILYVLKRKRSQLLRAGHLLGLHAKRLRAGAAAQSRPDARLRELRPHWRLVAPEHGSRALPHPARPTEVVAVDVDAYHQHGSAGGPSPAPLLGRLTSRVPRYATIELRDDYRFESDLETWQQRFRGSKNDNENDNAGDMDVEPPDEIETVVDAAEAATKAAADTGPKGSDPETWTVAEPFAVADPTLGRIDAEPDDPSQRTTAMLSLQFDVEEASTGFRQSAVLRSVAAAVPSTSSSETVRPDEKILFALQHSLFAAQLFESIRREIAPDMDEPGVATAAPSPTGKRGAVSSHHPGSAAWISQESSANFLPPPTYLSSAGLSGGGGSDLVPLCVIHCHEGEVKVQLDREYTLRVKLVEADNNDDDIDGGFASQGRMLQHLQADCPCRDTKGPRSELMASGSQTREQLLVLCRTLLYHAEKRYHEHAKKRAVQQQSTSSSIAAAPATLRGGGDVHARRQWIESPRILQSCVSLGSKLLMEQRVQAALMKVQRWLKLQATGSTKTTNDTNGNDEALHVTWLSLSVLDLHSHFTLAFRRWVADVTLVGEEITVTSTTSLFESAPSASGTSHEYRKVKFHSETQLELYLKLLLERKLMRKDDATGQITSG